MKILGISAYYHDSAAALVIDGDIRSAVQEERFTRKKHDANFPKNAVSYCLANAGIKINDVDLIVFYDKPILKFDRLLQTYINNAPRGLRSFLKAMPVWLKEKLYLKKLLSEEIADSFGIHKNKLPKLLFAEHHQSHAASAFYPSPFEKAAVLCLDGVGEWATTSVWLGDGNRLTPQWQINFPDSLGLLYSAFTYYTGFKVNSGEYKVMGLAPYGEPKYVDLIKNHLIDIKDDGTFKMNMEYFDYSTGLRMTNHRFNKLFGGPPRAAESQVTQKEMDLAKSVQVVTEEIVTKLCATIRKELNVTNICMAGGVALNCVANGILWKNKIFDKIWVQPAAGDAGGALGAALLGWYHYSNKPRRLTTKKDYMHGSYLGTELQSSEIRTQLEKAGAIFEELGDDELYKQTATLLAEENVVGWVQGRMEFGPRALGNRSILGDPRSSKMQSIMNLKIKYRESFRPFAPAVLAERVQDFFEYTDESPYMLMVAPVKKALQIRMTSEQENLFGIDKLHIPRSSLPAITHVDYSARIQTVDIERNPRFYNLIKNFDQLTQCPVLVNTSFNVRGEPIVCDASDAFRCFIRTEMDVLVVGNFLMLKKNQVIKESDDQWKKEFVLD